ncbi:MAG: hypothetical protein M1495_19960 [Bacteroidetes bacterium]|nr:hypothetical protein [Bacteroidota bacterium]
MAIVEQIQRIRETFSDNVQSVNELINFDEIVVNVVVQHLESLAEKLKVHHKLDNPYLSANSTLQAVKNIRKNNSLEKKYKRVFNQGLVLLVSYFASTIRDVFQSSIDEALPLQKFDKINKTQVSLSLNDLQNDIEKTRSIGEILSIQKDISFQDMQSIARSFQEYFSIEVDKNHNTNNIILAQACRHAIVHSGSSVDRKLINQISNAKPREVKENIELNSEILFTPDEIQIIGESMRQYLEDLFVHLADKFVIA